MGHPETSPGVDLSVIIPCRNAANTLGAQLEALTRQRTDHRWNVIVCDNGSSDDSVAVAVGFRHRLRLEVVTAGAVPGPSYARNAGVAASSARWIAFVDADDQVDDGWLGAVLDGLHRHDFIAGTFSAARLNPQRTVRTRPMEQQTGLQHSPFGPDLPHAASSNLAITRAAFESVGGFDVGLRTLEDTDLCWRVQLAGTPLVFWPDALVHMRLRDSLPSMYRQGYSYGVGAADLHHRYDDPTPRHDGTPPARTHSRIAGLRVAARTPGALAWQIGWHLGWRRGRSIGHRGPSGPSLSS